MPRQTFDIQGHTTQVIRLPFFAGANGHFAIEAHFMNKGLKTLDLVYAESAKDTVTICLTDSRTIHAFDTLNTLINGLTAFRDDLQERMQRGDIR